MLGGRAVLVGGEEATVVRSMADGDGSVGKEAAAVRLLVRGDQVAATRLLMGGGRIAGTYSSTEKEGAAATCPSAGREEAATPCRLAGGEGAATVRSSTGGDQAAILITMAAVFVRAVSIKDVHMKTTFPPRALALECASFPCPRVPVSTPSFPTAIPCAPTLPPS